MMYHAGFRPDGVFTAPLYRGRVIVPLGLPAGTLIPVNCSMGMSNLPDFRSWTGPARSGFVSESGGGNCEMSTFVPIEASGGMMLHPGPGPLAAGPGPLPARATSPSPRSPLPCAEAVLVRSIAVPSVIAERQATVFRRKLPPSERIKSIEPPFSQE